MIELHRNSVRIKTESGNVITAEKAKAGTHRVRVFEWGKQVASIHLTADERLALAQSLVRGTGHEVVPG